MALTQVNHDAFSRTSLMREVVKLDRFTHGSCQNCGRRSFDANRNPRLFRYYTEPDSYRVGRPHPIDGLFCSISCMRTYHGN